MVFPHFRGFRIKQRKRRKVYFSICFFLCLTAIIIVSLREYDNERIRLTEEILQIVGHDRNTSAKVLPLFTDTTLLHPSHGCQFSGRNALAIILVPSVTGNGVNRERIRTTWGKYRFQESMQLFFLVGKSRNGNMT
ncbi:unnamed protein product, partial [Allacma fusca]